MFLFLHEMARHKMKYSKLVAIITRKLFHLSFLIELNSLAGLSKEIDDM